MLIQFKTELPRKCHVYCKRLDNHYTVNNPGHNVLVDNTLLICRYKTTDINLQGDHFPTILSSDVRIHQLNENTTEKKIIIKTMISIRLFIIGTYHILVFRSFSTQ